MTRQARGRSRKRKAGLVSPGKGKPTKSVDERIDEHLENILKYLKEELDTYLSQPGMFKEVTQIGRALQQLRPSAPDHSEGPDDGPSRPDPHDRARFQIPPGL